MKDTKMHLLDSLKELAVGKPIDKITVREIAENAGVTTQTFYNHFSDKYEMIFWVYKCNVDILFDRLRKNEIDWNAFLNLFFCGYEQNTAFIQNAFSNTPPGSESYAYRSSMYFAEQMISYLKDVNGVKNLSEEVMVLVHMYASGVINAVAYWVFNKTNLTKADMVRVVDASLPAVFKDKYKIR